jgi:hypothetical protein
MPLLALVDVLRTISTLPSDEEWQSLKVDVGAGRRSVVLPYCGLLGYLRTSKLGVRHFAHKSARDCSSHPSETGQHLLAQRLAVEAACAAGWQADPEVFGDDWVADVLAVRGGRKVTFEMQWTAQTQGEYVRRQARYAAAGIRCAWFTPHGRSVLPARHDPPVFRLAVADHIATVTFNGSDMPLADAVTALLTGRISYRDHVSTGQPATMRVLCFEYPCGSRDPSTEQTRRRSNSGVRSQAGSGPIAVYGVGDVVGQVLGAAAGKQYRDNPVLVTMKVLQAAGRLALPLPDDIGAGLTPEALDEES